MTKAEEKADRVKVGADFIGWSKLKEVIQAANYPRNKLLILTVFKTGGRISEVLSLTQNNFDFNSSSNSIIIRDMKLSKNKSINSRGNFPVLLKEPLTDQWLELYRKIISWGQLSKYPNYPLFSGNNNRQPMTRQAAHLIMSHAGEKAGLNVGCHYFRGQRASQLAEEYDFDEFDLNKFFGWTRKGQASRYASLGWRGLERQMLEGYARLNSLSLQSPISQNPHIADGPDG